MTHIIANPEAFLALEGVTMVITGGAIGIGREVVIEAHRHGANVVIGDVAVEAGESLEKSLDSRCVFVRCNTASYQDQLSLFKEAHNRFGNIKVVVANAAIVGYSDCFDDSDDIEVEPSMREVDINLVGVMFTARIGLHYLRKSGGGDLIMTSSIAGFKETAYLTPYVASKHGVIGVLRGLRINAPEGIRINVVCPWMTRTGMTKGIESGWLERKLPVNDPADVARAILICATANRAQSQKNHQGIKLPFHGKIIFVGGGEAYEIEDRLQSLEPEWLGEENSQVLKLGQAYLHNGETGWSH
ncbi:unnamed protein product [Clonostachys rhizophaga]|uniref:Uncharacterized protein n=1 Tax=Clonostachys rhizophaga TaxID=160324 RepID=A0A9N9VJK2_9HYPO|nr:unnamed protein product [Clonostachys rhizophaga]